MDHRTNLPDRTAVRCLERPQEEKVRACCSCLPKPTKYTRCRTSTHRSRSPWETSKVSPQPQTPTPWKLLKCDRGGGTSSHHSIYADLLWKRNPHLEPSSSLNTKGSPQTALQLQGKAQAIPHSGQTRPVVFPKHNHGELIFAHSARKSIVRRIEG